MAVREILEGAAERTGWNLESMFDILCDYVDNQMSDDAFSDFVDRRVEDEMGEFDDEDEDEEG